MTLGMTASFRSSLYLIGLVSSPRCGRIPQGQCPSAARGVYGRRGGAAPPRAFRAGPVRAAVRPSARPPAARGWRPTRRQAHELALFSLDLLRFWRIARRSLGKLADWHYHCKSSIYVCRESGGRRNRPAAEDELRERPRPGGVFARPTVLDATEPAVRPAAVVTPRTEINLISPAVEFTTASRTA